MRHSLPLAPQFYVTAPQPCPYLADRIERKLFTALHGEDAQQLNDVLSQQGFRRSQNVLYRPACAECSACLSARISVADFVPNSNQKRTIKKNVALKRQVTSPWATEEQFALFQEYLTSRHPDGGMADMDCFEFASMIEETPVRTKIIEYSRTEDNQLVAACLTDILEDGVSLVYSFFDPAFSHASPGKYMILDHIEIARAADLPYVYLGYWVPGSPKMNYKQQFSGLEVFVGGKWEKMQRPEAYEKLSKPTVTDRITDQVANLSLPDQRRVRPR